MSIPCGRSIEHGLCCTEKLLCGSCSEIVRLRTVILAFPHERSRYYPKGCWCDARLNNPMQPDHTGSCKMAQRVMDGHWDEPLFYVDRKEKKRANGSEERRK